MQTVTGHTVSVLGDTDADLQLTTDDMTNNSEDYHQRLHFVIGLFEKATVSSRYNKRCTYIAVSGSVSTENL